MDDDGASGLTLRPVASTSSTRPAASRSRRNTRVGPPYAVDPTPNLPPCTCGYDSARSWDAVGPFGDAIRASADEPVSRASSGTRARPKRNWMGSTARSRLKRTALLLVTLIAAPSLVTAQDASPDTPLPPYWEYVDGVGWEQSTRWSLYGRDASTGVPGTDAHGALASTGGTASVNGAISDSDPTAASSISDPSASASSAAASASISSDANGVSSPDGWDMTQSRSIKVIIVVSVILCVMIAAVLFLIVGMRKTRRRKKDPERRSTSTPKRADNEKSETVETGKKSKVVFASGLRRTVRRVRRRRGGDVSGATSPEGSPMGSPAPSLRTSRDNDGASLQVASPAESTRSLRPASSDSRSDVGSHVEPTAEDDDGADASSLSALTDPLSHTRPRRRYPEPSRGPLLGSVSGERRQRVSASSADRPPSWAADHPPTYVQIRDAAASSSSAAGPSRSSRRDEKRRMVEPDVSEGVESLSSHVADALDEVDRGVLVGHIATDDKAALSRLRDLESAPAHLDLSEEIPIAPALDDDDQDDLPSHLLAPGPSSPPSALPSAHLPAPPQAVALASATFIEPAAPVESVPPWLPVYEPEASAPPLDFDDAAGPSAPPLNDDEEDDGVVDLTLAAPTPTQNNHAFSFISPSASSPSSRHLHTVV